MQQPEQLQGGIGLAAAAHVQRRVSAEAPFRVAEAAVSCSLDLQTAR